MAERRPRSWNSTLPAPVEPMKRGPAKKKTAAQRKRAEARKAREFARKYHSVERVVFVRYALECVVEGCGGLPENAHLDGEGTGRKGHYTRVAPICRCHHRTAPSSLHALGSVEAFDRVHHTDLETAAVRTDEAFQTWGQAWLAERKADGTFEDMRRAA